MTSRTIRIAMFYNTSCYVYNFRRSLLAALVARGYAVTVIAPFDGYEKRLSGLGVECIDLPFTSNTTDPVHDALLFIRFFRILRRLRPACLLCFTIKPNIYGSLAAQCAGIPVINTITGLGSTFLAGGFLTAVVSRLYRTALRRAAVVFFQNNDDRGLFIRRRLVHRRRTRLIPGSGVNTFEFSPRMKSAAPNGRFVFLLIARLLKDKGVMEYAEAASLLMAKIPGVVFRLLGEIDADNPTAVDRNIVERWMRDGIIDYAGKTDDVRPFIAEADCIVLPSYREGLSRTLLEAAAMAKPLIASDVPGCREVVEDGRNGLLCRVKDAHDLAGKMEIMASLPAEEREAMGRRGREKIEREFDERIVVRTYMEAIRETIEEARGRKSES